MKKNCYLVGIVFKTMGMSIQLERLCAPLSIVFLLFAGCSIDPEYDVKINEVNTEVTVFENGLSVPIGRTDSIALSQFLNSAGESIGDYLKKGEDGSLILTYDGNFSLTDKIAELDIAGKATMDGIEFNKNFSYHIGEINPENFSIAAQEFSYSFEFGGIDSFNPSIDGLNANLDGLSFKTGLDKYKNVINGNANLDLAGKIGNRDYSQVVSKPAGIEALATAAQAYAIAHGQSLDPDEGFDISSVLSNVDVPENTKIDVKVPEFKLHDEVSAINNLTINPNAKMVVSLQLVDPFICGGSIIPDVNIDLSGICNISGGSNINLSGLVLNPANSWTAAKNYNITGLATTSYAGSISIDEEITVSGSVVFDNPQTSLNTMTSTKPMTFKMSISFTDLSIESAEIAVAPVAFHLSDQVSIGGANNQFEIPDVIKDIKSVTMDESKPLYLRVTSSNLDRLKSKNIPYTIEMTFPSSIEVAGTVNNKLTLNGDLASGSLNQPIVIKAFHPVVSGGKIDLQTAVEFSADVSAENLVFSTAQLPSTPAEDISFSVAIDGSPTIKDVVITTNDIERGASKSEDPEFPIDGLDGFGSFSIVPEGNPSLNISCSIPSIAGLTVVPGEDGIRFELPDIIEFEESAIDPSLNFSAADNSFTIKNSIPSSISLPIKRIVVAPEGGKIKAHYSVDGKIVLPSGDVSYNDIQAAAGVSFGIEVTTPKITASSIALDDQFKFDIKEGYEFEFDLDTDGLLKSVDEVVLKDVYFNLGAQFEGLPALNEGQYLVDLTLTMPEFIHPNVIPIQGAVSGNKLNIAPVKIEKIAGIDLSESSHLKDSLKLAGSISASSSDISLASLQSDISCSLSASIANGEGKIAVSKASGVFSYSIDEGSTIALDNLPDILKGDGVTPDLDDPQIALTISTNLGISLKGNLELIPIIGEVEQEESKIVLSDIALPYSTTAETTSTKSFVICKDAATAPAGYEVLVADVSDLLAHLPDAIKVSIKANVDESVNAVMEPSAAYTLDVSYGITVPLAFGEDFNFATETDIDISAASQFIQYGQFGIKCKAVNETPLNLNVAMTLFDPDGVEIPQEKVSSVNIKGSSVSDVEFYLSPVDKTRSLSKAHLTITVTAVPGVTLKEDSFLQLTDIVAVLPEGITY